MSLERTPAVDGMINEIMTTVRGAVMAQYERHFAAGQDPRVIVAALASTMHTLADGVLLMIMTPADVAALQREWADNMAGKRSEPHVEH